MDNVEVPQHFICPISLQIMQDPVTVASGITYDRHAIERWLSSAPFCPITKHLLSPAPALIPNHTLRRLIHSWRACAPAPALLPSLHVINLIRGLTLPESRLHALRELEEGALRDEGSRAYMVEAGLATKLVCFVAACRREAATEGLKEALSILYIIRSDLSRVGVLRASDETVDSLMWVLGCDGFRNDETVTSHAAHVLKAVVEGAARGPGILERLRPDFFRTAALSLRGGGGGTEALLHVLLEACTCGRNRSMMVECGTVFDLVEVELRWSSPERRKMKKKTTELVLGVMYQLCLCAEGRAQLLSHAAGIAVVTRRMLEVSAAADERAVLIVWQIAKYAATKGVVEEMVRVGTVVNLCLVMVADSGWYVKEKARKILRMHFDAWKDSPCIEMDTLTRYTT